MWHQSAKQMLAAIEFASNQDSWKQESGQQQLERLLVDDRQGPARLHMSRDLHRAADDLFAQAQELSPAMLERMNSSAAPTSHPCPSPSWARARWVATLVPCWRAGHNVTLIGRASHMQAINEHGLRLQAATEDIHVPLATSTSADAVAGADVVLLCVKSTDTEAAAAQIKPYLARSPRC